MAGDLGLVYLTRPGAGLRKMEFLRLASLMKDSGKNAGRREQWEVVETDWSSLLFSPCVFDP